MTLFASAPVADAPGFLCCIRNPSNSRVGLVAQTLLREAHRQGQNLARTGVLEHLDDRAWTPLLVASAKGFHDVAEMVSGVACHLSPACDNVWVTWCIRVMANLRCL